jgi:hypothetical protein
MRRIGLFCVAIVFISCAPLPPIPFITDADVAPPVVTDLSLNDPRTLEVTVNEAVELVSGPLHSEGIEVSDVDVGSRSVRFHFTEAPSAEHEHHVEAQIADEAGNHLRFVARFYGLNALLPAMVINELTTQGSGGHPDLVELRALTDGNLAGACLYEGTPENWEQRLIFPPLDVRAGDYVVVHFKPEGIPEEIDEVTAPDASGGKDACSTAWDFWVPDGSGLSGNNGVISLCRNPLGGYIDAVLYSNRTSDSDERYRGFGSRDVMERADALAAAGAWLPSGSDVAPGASPGPTPEPVQPGRPPLAPEDAVDPEPSTATRSMARSSSAEDTNRASDWHITPTRGLTAGETNTDEVHVP